MEVMVDSDTAATETTGDWDMDTAVAWDQVSAVTITYGRILTQDFTKDKLSFLTKN